MLAVLRSMRTLRKDRKILFFDIDGTLAIGHDIPSSTQQALKKLQAEGHLLMICTGRSYEYAYQYFHDVVDGFITSNGRYIVYHDQVLLDEPLTSSQIQYFMQVMRKHHCGFAFFDHQRGYLENEDPIALQDAIDHYLPGFYQTSFQDDDVTGYMFDIYFPSHTQFEDVQLELKDSVVFNEHFPHPSADATIIGVDKGDGIDKVLDYFSLSKDDAFAFGDGANDLCMFQHVTHSIAMGNAIEELKKAAEYVTAAIDNDGIEKALQYYQLID